MLRLVWLLATPFKPTLSSIHPYMWPPPQFSTLDEPVKNFASLSSLSPSKIQDFQTIIASSPFSLSRLCMVRADDQNLGTSLGSSNQWTSSQARRTAFSFTIFIVIIIIIIFTFFIIIITNYSGFSQPVDKPTKQERPLSPEPPHHQYQPTKVKAHICYDIVFLQLYTVHTIWQGYHRLKYH